MSKPLEEVDPDDNPAAAAFQCIKFEEETPEGIYMCVVHTCMHACFLVCLCVPRRKAIDRTFILLLLINGEVASNPFYNFFPSGV